MIPRRRLAASVRPASTAPNGSTTANSRALRSVALASVLGTYAITLTTIATSRIWLIMSGQLTKCRATRSMAQATSATPARCSTAKASATAGPCGRAPNSASSPSAVTRACLGQVCTGASR